MLVVALSGCAAFDRYDKAGAAKLASATGLGTDTPPGFKPSFAGAVPDGVGGPGLVPTKPSAGVGGFWTLADGGVGISEADMITFYTERMMQHSLEHIEVECSEVPSMAESEQSRNVNGWGGDSRTRFRIAVSWAGSVQAGWSLNQELVVNKRVKDHPTGKVLAFRCRFVDDSLLLNLATKYGYTTTRIQPRNPNITLPPPDYNPT
jgi:hypothetical protein